MPDFDDDIRKFPSSRRRLRFYCEYLLIAGWALALRLLPRRVAVFWGTALGCGAYFLMRPDRRVAMANLDIVFGDRRSVWFKRELTWRSFQQIGEVVMGLLWAPRLTAHSVRRWVDVQDLTQLLGRLEDAGRGAVIVTPHYGDWELGCIAVAFAGYPMISVAEPFANPWLERLFTRCRTCSGNGIIAPKYALLKLVRALRGGKRVAIVCDVNGRRGRGGVWSDFFGLQVFNSIAIAELALRTRSAIVFVAVEPTGDGRHRAAPTLVEPEPISEHADDVLRVTQHVTDLVAEQLRRKPEPWLWIYKRWKRRPSEARNGYPHYSNFKRVK